MGRNEGKYGKITFSLQWWTGFSSGAEHSDPIHPVLLQFASLNLETSSLQSFGWRRTEFFAGQICQWYKE